MTTSRRLTRAGRRAQLLESALAIVRAEGTDALTLARVAEEAGVTKPVAYDHFGTRDGLLLALFQAYDDGQTERMRRALAERSDSVEAVARIGAAAYVDCLCDMGPEYGAIASALDASGALEQFHRTSRDAHVEEYRRAFAPFVRLDDPAGQAVLRGLLAACDGLARDAAAGHVERGVAIDALTRLMTGTLGMAAR